MASTVLDAYVACSPRLVIIHGLWGSLNMPWEIERLELGETVWAMIKSAHMLVELRFREDKSTVTRSLC